MYVVIFVIVFVNNNNLEYKLLQTYTLYLSVYFSLSPSAAALREGDAATFRYLQRLAESGGRD